MDAVVAHGCELLVAIYGAYGAVHPFVRRHAAAVGHLRGSSGAAAAMITTAFHRRFGAAAVGAAAGFAAMDGEDTDSQSASAMLRVMKNIITYEHIDHESRASATAFAASPALTPLLDVLRHHPHISDLLISAMEVFEQLLDTAAAQVHLAAADAVGAVALLLDRHRAVDGEGVLSEVSANCYWFLWRLAQRSEHDAALLRPSTVAAITRALPAHPIQGRYAGGAHSSEFTGVVGVAAALHMAAARNHQERDHRIAAIRQAAPGCEAKLNAWLAVLREVIPAGNPLLVCANALTALLAAVPAN